MKNRILLLLIAAVMAFPVAPARAQEGAAVAPVAGQYLAPDLSGLPDADLVVYVNPQKILNEALPKLLPAKQNDEMRASLDQLKKMLSIDVQQMRYIALTIRMRKPVGSDPMPLPEFLLVFNGGMNAATIAGLQMLGGPDVRTEKYGSREIYSYTSKDIAKQSEKMQFLGSYAEFAMAPVRDDVYVVGTPGFVRAALDADEGRGRMNPELARSITRDPENLISISGSMVTAMARGIALIGPDRPGCDCLNRFGHTYAAVRLVPNGLRITGALNGDNPETAGIIKNMITFLLKMAQTYAPDAETKSILAGMNITVEGNEVVGSGDVSQATIAKMLEKKPKQAASATPPPPEQPQVVTPVSTKPKTTNKRKRRTN